MQEYYTKPPEIITARALIVWDNHFLVLRRTNNHNHNPGKYELPGGKIDPGESIEQGLKRELNEEANIEIHINSDRMFFMNERIITDGNKYIGSVIKLYGSYLPIDQPPTINLSNEHDDFRWISIDQIDQINITSDSLTCINSFLANLL